MGTNDFDSAPCLQLRRYMRWIPVAILATLSLVGCGVGADEMYDEYGQVTQQQGDALHGSSETRITAPAAMGAQTFVTSGSPGFRDASTVGLPQDPVPLRDGRRGAQPQAPVDPLGSPRPTDNGLTR